ncbi:hypothetical protein [Streptomyces sp. FL07-04A]|jgi:hypothetical protein|uniref:hypothetical protein n=1 Tax=Streptomyces sp. FL07-04A TaxID=3028658 RepID=UPI0029AD0D97|nr:hypothetical protein [Streptomyces sp. FL07-04A]MDX3579238.1 hypothetical protein [Streptomyces sp. FL07-04A]
MNSSTPARRRPGRRVAAAAGLVLALGLGTAAQASAAPRIADAEVRASSSSLAHSDSGAPLSGRQMIRVLKSLLPKGAKISDQQGQEGYGALVWDDGRGKSMIGVNSQHDMGDVLEGHMGCEGTYIECQALTLADGTQVKRVKRASEKGGSAVVWLVDTLHRDGRRVIVQEVNSYAESGPVTRPQPPLTLNRLQAIALDSRWAG